MQRNEQIKLLFISPEYPPYNIGGGGLAFQQLSEELNRQGYSITVLSGNSFKEGFFVKPREEIINGVRIIRLPLLPHFLRLLTAKTFPNVFSMKIIREEIEKDYDYIIINGVFEGLSIYSSKLLRSQNKQYFLYAHGYPNLKNYSSIISIIFKFVEKILLIPMFKGARKVFSVSPKQQLPINTKYLPNGLDESFLNAKSNLNIREKHNIPKSNIVLFSLGRLNKNKGYQDVISAIKKEKNITYLIGGKDDGYETELKLLASENKNILFLGGLNTQEKKAYYTQSDIYINPSHEEFFGLTILEALACNTYILTSRVGIAEKVLNTGENGDFINNGNIKESILNYRKKEIENKPILLKYRWLNIAKELIKEISES